MTEQLTGGLFMPSDITETQEQAAFTMALHAASFKLSQLDMDEKQHRMVFDVCQDLTNQLLDLADKLEKGARKEIEKDSTV